MRVTKLAEEAFELDEPDILLDLRRLNGKPNATAFDKVWEELSTYVELITPAMADRGHARTLHMPIAISVGDLRDLISERLHTKFPEEEPSLPSVEWIRLQFVPRTHTAPTLYDIQGDLTSSLLFKSAVAQEPPVFEVCHGFAQICKGVCSQMFTACDACLCR